MSRMIVNHSCSRHGWILAGIGVIGAPTPLISDWAWRVTMPRAAKDRETLHKLTRHGSHPAEDR